MALKRFGRGLHALHGDPLPAVSAEAFEQDMHSRHFSFCGACGEFNGLVVHGLMRFPASYLTRPPEVGLCTAFPHPNVIEIDEVYMVCMDSLAANGSGPNSARSSSYCMGTLLHTTG